MKQDIKKMTITYWAVITVMMFFCLMFGKFNTPLGYMVLGSVIGYLAAFGITVVIYKLKG